MITLDYRTLNPRWGYSGLYFNSWESYSFTLGYLSNPAHHRHLSTIGQGIISIHVEPNHEQDAWPTKVVFIITAPYKAWRSTSKT